MTHSLREVVEQTLRAIEAKNIDAVMEHFHDDALVFDPHYPEPEMRGRAAIRRGFEFSIGMSEQPGFIIQRCWTSERDGSFEVDTHHVLKSGMHIRVTQLFVVDVSDGLITRWTSYVPYAPPVRE